MNIPEALVSLHPTAQWTLVGTDYAGLDWKDQEITKPSEQVVMAEVARLQAIFDANQYQRDRAQAYPSVQDQLDMLYHGGYEGWRASIQTVKNQFPKP